MITLNDIAAALARVPLLLLAVVLVRGLATALSRRTSVVISPPLALFGLRAMCGVVAAAGVASPHLPIVTHRPMGTQD